LIHTFVFFPTRQQRAHVQVNEGPRNRAALNLDGSLNGNTRTCKDRYFSYIPLGKGSLKHNAVCGVWVVTEARWVRWWCAWARNSWRFCRGACSTDECIVGRWQFGSSAKFIFGVSKDTPILEGTLDAKKHVAAHLCAELREVNLRGVTKRRIWGRIHRKVVFGETRRAIAWWTARSHHRVGSKVDLQ